MLVDDHDLVRVSLANLLAPRTEIEITGQFGNPAEAIAFLEKEEPELAMIDLMLGQGSGLDIVRHIEEKGLATEVLMITGMASPVLINLAISLKSVRGIVSKYDSASEVLAGLEAVSAHENYLSPSLKKILESGPNTRQKLTVREFEVMALVADGMEDKEVAQRLSISLPTVKTHRRNLRSKLGVRNTAELTKFALTGRR